MTIRRARSFWVTGPGRGEIRGQALPALAAGQVRVRSLFSGISRGTESLVFQGRVPGDQHLDMRAPWQEGNFPAPVKYGYSNVGLVEEGPERLCGQTVFCLYPHQDLYHVPETAVLPLPEGIPTRRAVLAANMETAINGLWDAAPRPGERIAVVGGGALGSLTAYLAAKIPGCRVQLIDVDPDRAAIASRLGVRFALPAAAEGNVDLAIHASGNPGGLATALELAAFEARIIELSWYGDRTVSLPLGRAFHSRRLQLISSQVGVVSPHARPRWSARQRLSLALSLLDDPALDCLTSDDSPFLDLPETMARLATEATDALCHVVVYGD